MKPNAYTSSGKALITAGLHTPQARIFVPHFIAHFVEDFIAPLVEARPLLRQRVRRRLKTGPFVPAPTRGLLAAVLLLLLLPGVVWASPSSALRQYKDGKFDQAMKEYERLLQRNQDDPRLHFNAGVSAYRNRQLDEAAKQFGQAIATPDLKLQQEAYYNRGNSLYWLGAKNPDPAKRTEAWENALKDFDLSMKLNPQDADAKFNHEFVKKKLEELKKQQQQQQNQKNNSDKQKKNQQQQSKQNQQQKQKEQKQDQQKQQQANQNQQKQQQNSAQQKKEDQQQQQAAEQEQKKKQQQAQQSAAQEKKEQQKKQQQQAAASQADEMTPEQARQLLDAQKGDEKVLQLAPETKPRQNRRPLRDW